MSKHDVTKDNSSNTSNKISQEIKKKKNNIYSLSKWFVPSGFFRNLIHNINIIYRIRFCLPWFVPSLFNPILIRTATTHGIPASGCLFVSLILGLASCTGVSNMATVPVRPTISVAVELRIVVVAAAWFPVLRFIRFTASATTSAASTGLAQVHGLEQRQ